MPAGTPLHLFICTQHTPSLSHPISSSLPYLFFISRLSSFKNLCSFNLVMAMSARSISTFSVSNKQGGDGVANISSSSSLLFNSSKLGSSSTLSFNQQQGKRRNLAVSISASSEPLLTGVVFHPFEEVKKEALALPVSPQLSLARQGFADHCESAINEQINVEYNVSYVYHAMFAYFDRDNVALKGLAKFYKESSEEERDHAEKLMKYQNIRGGKVKLHSIINPPSEFEHAEKGDALYAMELALSLEKLTNEKLLSLHRVAQDNNDAQLTDFIESEFLTEQVEAIKKIAEYVTQLRLVGKGHGVWHFDQQLLHEG